MNTRNIPYRKEIELIIKNHVSSNIYTTLHLDGNEDQILFLSTTNNYRVLSYNGTFIRIGRKDMIGGDITYDRSLLPQYIIDKLETLKVIHQL